MTSGVPQLSILHPQVISERLHVGVFVMELLDLDGVLLQSKVATKFTFLSRFKMVDYRLGPL
jgi:hypothetical protein